MNIKRAVTIALAGGSLAVWLAAAATSGNRDVSPIPVAAPAPIDARGAALSSEIARLHDRLRPSAAPQRSRNLFQFAAVRARPAPAPIPAARPALSEAAATPRPAPPPLKLIGVAEDAGPSGPIRTAILSAPGQLLFVKEGDAATPRYRVAKISSEVIELTDTLDGTALRLALK
jgi:hypothetical protein